MSSCWDTGSSSAVEHDRALQAAGLSITMMFHKFYCMFYVALYHLQAFFPVCAVLPIEGVAEQEEQYAPRHCQTTDFAEAEKCV